jgi:hypothetical protein
MKSYLLKTILCLTITGLLPTAKAQLSYTVSGGVASITGYNTAAGLNVVIPANTNGYPVTSIGAMAFYGQTNIINVTIPNSVISIGFEAFTYCSDLTSVMIPNSVISIGDSAFMDCYGLTNIIVDIANPSYASASGVLFNKNLTLLIQYPGGLAGSYAIPNSVTSIGTGAFYYCPSLTNVTIPNGVISIGNGAFSSCYGLTSVTIPNSVISIGSGAFYGCTSLHQAYFQGNAPSSDAYSVFAGESGMAYFLPGTTGWGSAFGGWPTAPWYQPQPQILGSGNSLGVQSNGFQFTISWATNTSVVVQASTDVLNWSAIVTNSLVSGTNTFTDSNWTNYPRRFYRVRSL